MKRIISFFLVVSLALLLLSGCKSDNEIAQSLDLKSGDVVEVTVTMKDSGKIKSMALSVNYNQDDFELLDGQWLNHQAILSDFNLDTKDAAIAFEDGIKYFGEIFSFRLQAKHDFTASTDEISVIPVLKNEERDISCSGIGLAMEKVLDGMAL